MSGPPYHLRTNKAADRFALIEAIRRLPRLGYDLEEYTYYGLGGAYLEDIRLLYEYCPEIAMVSIEQRTEVFERQQFHLPCGKLVLENTDVKSYITGYNPDDHKSIFWLDYTDLHYSDFDDFSALLTKLVVGSMVKITLRADSRDYFLFYNHREKARRFREEFSALLPDPSAPLPRGCEDFAYLVQKMLRIAAQRALPSEANEYTLYPISSFYYSDGTWMFTLTGVIWPRSKMGAVEKAYNSWEFANLTWNKPRLIDLPDLSTKERLHLQQFLPCESSQVDTLLDELGHLVEDDIPQTKTALEQYAAFHRYYPYFLRGAP
jgi:hypothetical protein